MYDPVNIKLSLRQLKSLLSGKSVRVSPADLVEGAMMVFLTPQQIKRRNKALKDGKGMILSFTPELLRYNIQNGGSFWSKLLEGAKNLGRKIYQTVVKPTWENLQPSLEEGRQRLIRRGTELGTRGIDYALKRTGSGMPKKGVMPPGLAKYHAMRRQQKMKGEGFLEDIMGGGMPPMVEAPPKKRGRGFFKNLGKIIRPIAGNLAQEGIKQYVAPAVGSLISGDQNQSGSGLRGDFLFGSGVGEIAAVPTLMQSKKNKGGSFKLR